MKTDRPLLQRPFEEAFRWTLLAIVLWSYAALVFTGQLPPWFAAGSFALLVAAWIGEKKFPIPRRGWHALIAGFLVLDFWVFRGPGRIDAVVYALVFLLTNKLWNPKKTRDILQILLISFFFMVAAAVMTTRMSFVLNFVVFLFLLVVGLIFLTVRREHDALIQLGVGRRSGVNPGEIVPPQLYARAWGAVVCVLVVTVSIFVLFPRFSTNNFLVSMAGRGGRVSRSGFGNEIELGSASSIALNPIDVLRVQVEDPRRPGIRPMDAIYLRGAVVETYEHGRWSANVSLHPTRTRTDFMVRFHPETLPACGPVRELKQTAFLDPDAGPDLFAMENAAQIDFNPNREARVEIDDQANTCRLLASGGEILTYRVTSYCRAPEAGDPQGPQARETRPLHEPPLIRPEAYVLLPPTPRAEETRQLAESIVAQAGATTQYEKAQAVERHLRTHYGYTLTNLECANRDPTEAFLLDPRKGNCEYFASAMAVLLRRLGIPCRIVNGFYTNRWNGVMNFYLVKESDAHSWLEVYFPTGWIAFDPTPPESIVRDSAQSGAWRDLANWIDAIRMKWYLHVIDYDLGDQRTLVRVLGNKTPHLAGGLAHWSLDRLRLLSPGALRSAGGAGIALGLGLAALLALFAVFGVGLTVARRRRSRQSQPAVLARRRIRIYERILATLARYNLPRPLAATPREHARYVEGVRPDLTGFRELTERYYAARYADVFLTEDEEAMFEHFLRRVQLVPPRGPSAAAPGIGPRQRHGT